MYCCPVLMGISHPHVMRGLPDREALVISLASATIATSAARDTRPMADDHDHDHGAPLSQIQLRVRALETILPGKGYVTRAALQPRVEAYEPRTGPRNGGAVFAKAWTVPAFRQALLRDATAAIATLGHVSRVGDHLVAVENTP